MHWALPLRQSDDPYFIKHCKSDHKLRFIPIAPLPMNAEKRGIWRSRIAQLRCQYNCYGNTPNSIPIWRNPSKKIMLLYIFSTWSYINLPWQQQAAALIRFVTSNLFVSSWSFKNCTRIPNVETYMSSFSEDRFFPGSWQHTQGTIFVKSFPNLFFLFHASKFKLVFFIKEWKTKTH